MIHRAIPVLVILGAACLVLPAERPASPAIFTAAQANAGRVAYERTCGQCHTYSLMGRKGDPGELPPVSSLPAFYRKFIETTGHVPPLAGKDFLDRWGAKTAAELIARFQVTAGDSFFQFQGMDDDTTVNITAYALQVSGAKAGTEPLTRTTQAIVNSVTR